MRRFILFCRRHFPILDLLVYARASRRDEMIGERQVHERLTSLVEGATHRRCLQVGHTGERPGPGWTVVDLEDSTGVDVRMDARALGLVSECFDLIVCNSVLERVSDPRQAIAELGRVLRPGGEIWVEVPFVQEHKPSGREDHWRVTQEGLRVWMRDFHEVRAGLYGNPLWNGAYFHGRKPLASRQAPDQPDESWEAALPRAA